MSRPYLTVLTAPVPDTRQRLIGDLRRRIRPLVKPGVPLPATSPYPGHYALVRSVVEGLRTINADFNFNPRRLSDVARVVYAPANEALRQAAALKREGRIDYLVAGPVNALFADECDGILQLPEIDRLIVAHEWALEFYRESPALRDKSRACPCGVDTDVWKPAGRREAGSLALIYWKSGGEEFCDHVETIVRRCGLEPRRVRSMHGDHAIFTPADYRRLLEQSAIGVFLSTFETQGLALAEAWSMDVPTLVWDPQGTAEWRGRAFASRSSAPYLTPATGRAWRTIDELEPALRGALRDRAAFRPREWVLGHMTDAICSAALLEIIREGAGSAQATR
jgi:glycosyltransferase involved in cell wall biosynthesis